MKLLSFVGRIGGFLLLCVLTLVVWVGTFLTAAATGIMGLVSGLLGTWGLLVLVLVSRSTGVQMLFAAFLLSQYGLPMVAALLLGVVNGLKNNLKEYVFA